VAQGEDPEFKPQYRKKKKKIQMEMNVQAQELIPISRQMALRIVRDVSIRETQEIFLNYS
jgi:hypothetical protein